MNVNYLEHDEAEYSLKYQWLRKKLSENSWISYI